MINFAKKNYDIFYIDWNLYFKIFSNYKIFKHDSIQTEFLSIWKKKLIESEQKSEGLFYKLDLTIEHFPIRLTFNSLFIG
ncbi:hypothetical protein ACFJYO_15945, partial [Enterococcus faecalis]